MPDNQHQRLADETAVILYDGVCGLCNRLVRFVVKRDGKGVFRFASLQSPAAREILARHGISADPLDTFYVVLRFGLAGEHVLSKSSAAIYTAARLGGIWKLATLLKFFPQGIRDRAYDAIARRRYRWFGKYESCPLPDPAYRERFMDVGVVT